MSRLAPFLSVALLSVLGACGSSSEPEQYGPDPMLPDPHRGLLPTMEIAKPAGWDGKQPVVPQGYRITAIATDLRIPARRSCSPTATFWSPKARAVLRPG